MNKSTPPPAYEFLNGEKTKELLKVFKGERTGWVMVGPKNYIFPSNYVEQGEKFYNFKARSTDTWVVSYPRSGKYIYMNFCFIYIYIFLFIFLLLPNFL